MRNRGTEGGNAAIMSAAFEKNLRAVDAWLASKTYVKTLRVPYRDVVNDPQATAQKITQFLEMDLDVEAMTQQVDSKLYRNRSK